MGLSAAVIALADGWQLAVPAVELDVALKGLAGPVRVEVDLVVEVQRQGATRVREALEDAAAGRAANARITRASVIAKRSM